MSRLDVSGRVALITGARQGIGNALARELTARGATVVGLDMAESPGVALSLTADVTDREAMRAAVERIVQRFGRLDVVVANAGVAPTPATLRTMDPAEYDRVIAVNQTGVFNTVHPAIEPVIAQRGHIHVVASVAAFSPGSGASPYMISKAAAEQIGRALRLELAPHGASAGVAYFGFVDTPMTHAAIDNDPLGHTALAMMPGPMRRRIRPEEAGRVIADGIARRAPVTIAPSAWKPLRWARGLGGLLDAAIARDPRAHKLIRKTEAASSPASPSTPSSASPAPPPDPDAAPEPARPAGTARS
jgi:NAD(P)-dependent dehydrogenase (short-subunit alcohol dehydrogenase family)